MTNKIKEYTCSKSARKQISTIIFIFASLRKCRNFNKSGAGCLLHIIMSILTLPAPKKCKCFQLFLLSYTITLYLTASKHIFKLFQKSSAKDRSNNTYIRIIILTALLFHLKYTSVPFYWFLKALNRFSTLVHLWLYAWPCEKRRTFLLEEFWINSLLKVIYKI